MQRTRKTIMVKCAECRTTDDLEIIDGEKFAWRCQKCYSYNDGNNTHLLKDEIISFTCINGQGSAKYCPFEEH